MQARPSQKRNPIVFDEDLMRSVPGLAKVQAREVLLSALQEYSRLNKLQIEESEVQTTIDRVANQLLLSKDILLPSRARQLAGRTPLVNMLGAAGDRLERRQEVPYWPGGEDMLNHLLGRAQSLRTRLALGA